MVYRQVGQGGTKDSQIVFVRWDSHHLAKAELDIWMHCINNHYEYIAVYVDDLAIASKDPKAIFDILTNVHGFKLKGMGPIEYHLGSMTFHCNEQEQLCISSR